MIQNNRQQGKQADCQVVKKVRDIYSWYHTPDYIGMDPLTTLQCFSKRNDLEIAALIASALAYGRVETIISSIGIIFNSMQKSPFDFVTSTDYTEKKRQFKLFKHRFTQGEDIALLLQAVAAIIRTYGSIETLFSRALAVEPDRGIAGALEVFCTEVRTAANAVCHRLPEYFNFLLPSPADGSACKRMNMYLRWMVRPADGIDFGVWKSVSPSILLIPVDTHIARIARELGITKRKTADWRMAEEITSWLRLIDADDPVKFDFSLCRSGMMDVRRSAA